ncbi:hypothetical protein QBC43DRAFT_107687 [Cladorrhinum sp. PSN259]|nr:hypothetical protein QBC43DRAFT_107687 [Cladorrhinum sp. PSN259]
MSFQPQFHVPGTFTFESGSTRPGQALSAGIFRPPAHSPPESTYGSLYSDISMSNTQATGTAKRKRMGARESTPAGWERNMDVDSMHDSREDDRSRQIRYTLAGQINATPFGPAVGAENGLLEESVYSDVDYRKRLGPTNEPESPSDQPYDAGNAEEPETRPPGWSIFNPLGTIGEMVGKVWEFCRTGAFRGFHAGGGNGYTFNGTTVTETKPTGTDRGQVQAWCNEHDIPTLPSDAPPINNTLSDPFQQAFSPFTNIYQDDYDSPDSTQRPAAKRRQVSANRDELRNWVVVDEQPEENQKPANTFSAGLKAAASSRPHAPIRTRSTFHASSGRRISAPSTKFTGGTPRARSSLARISHAESPDVNRSFTPTPREPASFASPRQSTATPVHHETPSRIPVPRQSYSSNPFITQPTLTSPISPTTTAGLSSASRPSSRQSPRHSIGSSLPSTSSSISRPSTSLSRPISPTKPNGIHRRNQSGASASARRHSLLSSSGVLVDADTTVQASPRLSAEAKQLAQKKLAVEKETDAKVDAFNARLMAMIRQGREALGTKVEVEMVDDFGGAGGGGGGGGGGTGWEDDEDSYL